MQMMRATCARCQFVYDILALPIAAMMMGRVKNRCCPICGNVKNNTMADPRALNDDERVAKARAIALEAR